MVSQYNLSSREFIESVYLIFNLGSTEALLRIFRIPKNIRSVFNDQIKLLRYVTRNYNRSCLIVISVVFIQFQLKYRWSIGMETSTNVWHTSKICPIFCAALHRSRFRRFEGKMLVFKNNNFTRTNLRQFHRDMLLRFSIAYQSKVLKVPITWLKRILIYDNTKDVINDCKYYNISCDLSSDCVRFNHSEFDATRPVVSHGMPITISVYKLESNRNFSLFFFRLKIGVNISLTENLMFPWPKSFC